MWTRQLASGPTGPVLHADDYIDEMLTLLVPNLIKEFGASTPWGSLLLESTDEDRVWRAASGTAALEPVERATRLIGTTSDLFLALWRRPNSITVVGDPSTLESWSSTISGS